MTLSFFVHYDVHPCDYLSITCRNRILECSVGIFLSINCACSFSVNYDVHHHDFLSISYISCQFLIHRRSEGIFLSIIIKIFCQFLIFLSIFSMSSRYFFSQFWNLSLQFLVEAMSHIFPNLTHVNKIKILNKAKNVLTQRKIN